jgi:ribonuclease Z
MNIAIINLSRPERHEPAYHPAGHRRGHPPTGRSQSAVLLDNGQPLLFDCGAGTILRLEQAGVSTESLDTVVLTHLHLDHVSDLLALANARYLQQLPGPEVYGPEGTDIYFKIVRSAYPNLERMQVSVHEVKPKDCFSVKGCDILAEEATHSVTARRTAFNAGEG